MILDLQKECISENPNCIFINIRIAISVDFSNLPECVEIDYFEQVSDFQCGVKVRGHYNKF